MRQAVRLADVGDVSLISEPEAAAIHYAIEERVPTGAVVGVYDFGGGTFDATVLRTSAGGFELIGRPEGMERLGGIDFDEAVLRHVLDSVRDAGLEPDAGDPGMLPALARLREECRRAKEALSSDTDTTIAVQLPAASMDVRLTRPELEAMIRPRIAETISALGRAVRSAGLDIGALDRVLLVGGSSRIPLVSEMVREATARPVALDAHPKHTMALGAAYSARYRLTGGQMMAEPAHATPSVTEVGAARPSFLDGPSGTGRLSRWLGGAPSVRGRAPILALAVAIVLVLVVAGLGLSSLTGRADPTLSPEGTQPVASQPHATALARPDSRPVAVPMLVGLREDAVRATLEAAGLVPGLRRGAFHPTTPLGEVIDQSPLAGAELLPGGAVDYTVSAGPRPVAVPMLVGLREDAVRATLEAAGLAPGLRRGAFHPTTPLGEVIDQSTPRGRGAAARRGRGLHRLGRPPTGGRADAGGPAGGRGPGDVEAAGLVPAAARRVPPHDAAGRGHRPVTPRGRGAAARRGRGLHRLGRPPTGGSGRLAMSVASSPGPTTLRAPWAIVSGGSPRRRPTSPRARTSSLTRSPSRDASMSRSGWPSPAGQGGQVDAAQRPRR